MTIENWTDERLDDLAAALAPLPAQMARNTEAIERLTDDVRQMREDMRAMRVDMAAMQRQLSHIGWGVAGFMTVQFATLVVALT